ncbi:MAG: hypothetical protein KDE26_01090 [Bacteroidetes bacterium]|nr:hypothetical protein [Bacteroidota bacterium]MCB0841838.1 hypothetical protein [Bacteroidota bacterium]
MSKQKNTENPQSLTADKLWPVVLTMDKGQMEALFVALVEHLHPWPKEKLLEVRKEVKAGKVLTEEQFRERFAKYINPS